MEKQQFELEELPEILVSGEYRKIPGRKDGNCWKFEIIENGVTYIVKGWETTEQPPRLVQPHLECPSNAPLPEWAKILL